MQSCVAIFSLAVRWWISDRELTLEERLSVEVMQATGMVDAEFFGSYSEITGHLWTNEKFKVGGHDMLSIMRHHIGKWCYLEVTTHE